METIKSDGEKIKASKLGYPLEGTGKFKFSM